MDRKNLEEKRSDALQRWLDAVLGAPFQLTPLTPGAGLRRYFRVALSEQTYVVMTAPPDEKCQAFVRLSQAFQKLDICAPAVHASDLGQGFLLLTDFGNRLYEQALNPTTADSLYQNAFASLLRLQSYQGAEHPLKSFDMGHYRLKMTWFYEYYLKRYLNQPALQQQIADLEKLFDLLIHTALQQPQRCVHYDYHCRNLMRLPGDQVGVLDFQDAVRGPITYDLMSLLRDCYIDWPEERVQKWMGQYLQLALNAGAALDDNPQQWRRWCDFSSLQRHLKCIGLFARFHVTGHSSDYLIYIPRLLNYTREISRRYPELSAFNQLVENLPK